MTSMHILIIKLGAMGDVVRTSYAANALGDTHRSNLRVTWVTERNCFDLLRFNPFVHAITTAEELKQNVPSPVDWALSLDDERVAAELALLVNAKSLSGAYVENGRLTYTEDSSAWFDMGLISKHGKVEADRLKKANKRSHAEIFAGIFRVPGVKPGFFGSSTMEADWRFRRSGMQKVVGFNLFAGKRWPSKEMPQHEAMRLMRSVSEYLSRRYDRFKLVVFCDESNRERSKDYLIGPEVSVWNCSASSLEYASAIKACDYLFSTDSLGLHFAIAQRVPNLSYYAPTSALEIDTFDTGKKVVAESADYCSYRPAADNSTLTADRIFQQWLSHVSELEEWR
jgi:heptosyltransferase II